MFIKLALSGINVHLNILCWLLGPNDPANACMARRLRCYLVSTEGGPGLLEGTGQETRNRNGSADSDRTPGVVMLGEVRREGYGFARTFPSTLQRQF